jgi:hypothetical protein
MEAGLRRRMEAGFGADLSGVRLHTGPAAAAAARDRGALAFTAGAHIHFAAGRFAPGTPEGERLLAHELAHVLQQRAGPAFITEREALYRAGERESTAATAAVLAGRRAGVSVRSGGLVQDQDASGHWRPHLVDPSELQLHLDPEIEAILLRHYLRWWIGTTLTEGEPPTPGPAEGGTTKPATGVGTLPGPRAPLTDEMPLSPELFRPIPPPALYRPPDVGAILAPYGRRGVALGERDGDAATEVYQRNYRFVSALPDLRDAAPSFLRPLIPHDWRRSIAGAFTAATLDAQLRHDYPTAIELSDQAFRNLTGASTVYIPIPAFSF